MNWDIVIFQYINGFAGQYKILDLLGVFFAKYSQYFLGVFLLLLLFWPKNHIAKNRPMIIVGLAAAVIARFLLKPVIYHLYGRVRPFISLPVNRLLATPASENFQSFPSGHAVFFFALSYVIYKSDKKLGWWFFTASSIMGLARIFVGIHWPSDIIGGAIIGMAVALIVQTIYNKYKEKINSIFNF